MVEEKNNGICLLDDKARRHRLDSNQGLRPKDWWEGRGTIPRPGRYEHPALPTELPSQEEQHQESNLILQPDMPTAWLTHGGV